MRVRCTATADYRSNAVGDLELECTAEGLRVSLRGVSSYREGYAPGPPVHESAVCVPWGAVYATRLGERQLQLSVDARNLPLNRFVLVDFFEPPPEDAKGKGGRLAALLAGAALIALGIGLWALRALPHAPAFGTFGWAAVAVMVVLAAIAWRARAAPRAPAHVILDELCLELARYVPHHISAAAPTPPSRSLEPGRLASLSSLLPRSTVAIAITLAATTLAALIGSSAARPKLTGGASDVTRAPPFPLGSLVAPLGAPAAGDESGPTEDVARGGTWPDAPEALDPGAPAAVRSSAAKAPALAEPCACARHESLAWRAPLPRVTPVIISQRTRTHDRHEHTELELALVNDGNREARQLNVSVLFFESRSGERAGQWQTGERSLVEPGPLEPGQTVRWHVEGRGTSIDVIAPDLGTLAPDGSDAAPAEAYVRLSSGGARALQLHAVRMLAFLADDRAHGTARALRASASPSEADYLDRLLEPPPDVAACALHVDRESTPWRVGACLFNRSDRTQVDLDVRLLAFDSELDRMRPGARAPALLAEHATGLHVTLPARTGRRVELGAALALGPGSTPRAFELATQQTKEAP